MRVDLLLPKPTNVETFRRARERFIPESSGCYVLTTFLGEVLYMGLTRNLRRRMNEHLDTPEKVEPTQLGRAFLFHWIECSDIVTIERTWLDIHIRNTGGRPLLNKVDSPIST